MIFKYRPMAIMGFSSLFILFICAYVDDRFSLVSIGVGIVILFLCIFVEFLRKSAVPFFLAAALILSGASFEILSDYKISDAQNLVDRDVTVTATLVDEPDFNGTRYYYIFKTESIDGEAFDIKLRVSTANALDAEPYDKLSANLTLYEIGKSSDDLKLYYQSKGIFLGGYLNNYGSSPVTVVKSEKKSAGYYFLKLRRAIESSVLDKLPNDYGGVAVGMLTGNKDYISDAVYADIKAAGVAPVFAVSGMHLSVWILGLYGLLELLNVNKRLNSVIGLVFIVLFMGVTGFTPSVCRAGIMLMIVLVGNLFYRRADSVNSLGFATLLLCISNPMIVADIGFLLSFSSTLGIVLFNPVFKGFLGSRKHNGIIFKIIRLIAESVFVSVSATLGSLGFVIAFIGYVSVYSVLSNLLISYAASMCMLTSGLSVLFSFASGISDGLAIASGTLSKYIIWVIAKISDLPLSTVDTSDIRWTIGIIFVYAAVISLYIILRRGAAFKISCCVVAAAVVISSTVYYLSQYKYCTVKILETDSSVNVLIFENGYCAAIFSNGDYKYLAENVADVLNGENADAVFADTYFTGSSSTYLAIKRAEPQSVIVPKCERSLMSICDGEKIKTAKNAQIALWGDTTAKFVSNADYCLFTCELNKVRITAVLRQTADGEIPAEYLSGDILICTAMPENADFDRTVICGEDENGLISTEKYGEITLKIKNSKYKISTEL